MAFGPSNPSASTKYYDVIIDDPALTQYGFTKISLPLSDDNTAKMILHNDKDASMFTYSDFDKDDLDKSVNFLHDKIIDEQQVESKLGKSVIEDIDSYFKNACTLLAEDQDSIFFKNGNGNGNGNGKSKPKKSDKEQQKQEQKTPHIAYKYSKNGRFSLHESVILAGRPIFLTYENDKIQPYYVIEEDIRVIEPPHPQNYPYQPYEFENMVEVLNYRDRALGENIDSLYLKAKQIASEYNDQREEKINLLAMEIISSYFQDRFPTTHYDIILGGNGSGKSTYGDTFTAVGYRVVNLTDPNAANINRILGPLEIGQCTIVSDETGAIERQPDLMAILKTGYSARGKTSKINDLSRVPEFFYTYCFKMIISERMPNLRDARGVADRSFSFTTYKGLPKYDIKETLEPQRNKARQQRLDALNDFKKLMLVYRLIHFKDEIHDIDIGIEGREKELSKPIIQLFYNTQAQNEVEATLQYFLNLRTEKKEITLEPILHPLVVRLVSKYGNEISVKQIWGEIKETIQGYFDEKKPNEYQTLEYGTIYNNTISSILEHTFGGRSKHRENGNTFIFDPEELKRVGRTYNLTTKIQTRIIVVEEEEHRTRPEGSEGNEGYREGHILSNDDKIAQNIAISRGNLQAVASKKGLDEVDRPSIEPSEGSDPSGQVIENSSIIKHNSYFSYGKWHCSDCKTSGDKFHMENTHCRGSKK